MSRCARSIRWWRATIGAALGAAGTAAAPAQQSLPGAGAFAAGAGGRESHAWIVMPASGRTGFQLFHIPPRGGIAGAPGVVADGAASSARPLDRAPEALAAWDSRVFLVFAPEQPRPGRVQRRVLSLRAERSPLGDAWTYRDPGDQRMEALAPIPGDGTLLGVVGSARGPMAMIDHAAWGGLALIGLGRDGWARLPLPPAPDAPESPPGVDRAATPTLVATERGPAVLVRGPRPGLWIAAFAGTPRPLPTVEPPAGEGPSPSEPPPPAPNEPPPPWPTSDAPSWTWYPLSLDAMPAGADGPAYWIRGRLVLTRWIRGTGLTVWTADAGGTHRLVRIPRVPAGYAAAPLEQSARLVVMWPEGEPPRPTATRPGGTGPTPSYQYRIAEVSAQTGRVFYDGLWSPTAPISPKEFRGLVLLLLAVMALVVLFVVRPRGTQAPLALPAGFALAESSRRMAAGAIDLLPCVFIASKLSGVAVSDLFAVSALLGDTGALMLVADVLALAWAHTTICEWLFRQSLGKALVGCEVGRVVVAPDPADGLLSPRVEGLTLWRSAARNLVKWGLPPVALFGLGTPEHRHAGDTVAGSVVFVRYTPDAPGDDEPGE